jgi:hypothetical protein
VDGANEAKKAEFAYTCICVTPILLAGYTICDTPLCKLTDSQAVGEPPQVKCTGHCTDPCTCTLLRLHVKGKTPEKKAVSVRSTLC